MVSCTILKLVSLFKDNNSNFTLFSAKNGSFFVWLENKKQFLTIESITGWSFSQRAEWSHQLPRYNSLQPSPAAAAAVHRQQVSSAHVPIDRIAMAQAQIYMQEKVSLSDIFLNKATISSSLEL